jgi:hypothetical protein
MSVPQIEFHGELEGLWLVWAVAWFGLSLLHFLPSREKRTCQLSEWKLSDSNGKDQICCSDLKAVGMETE